MPKGRKRKDFKPGTWFQCDLCGTILHNDDAVDARVVTAAGRGSRRQICQKCEVRHERLLR